LGFNVIFHKCGQIFYEGTDMIHLFRLRRKTDNKFLGYGRKLAIHPLSVEVEDKELQKVWFSEKL
jgi:hypothetical protein